MRRKSPKNQPQKPGLPREGEPCPFHHLEELAFPVAVFEFSGVNEENQIKARLEAVLVQAENFPDLTFRSVSFNGISEFLG